MEHHDDPYYDPYEQDYAGNHEEPNQCESCGRYVEDCECGNNADNQAAARVVSSTLKAPGDRANELSRRPQLDHSYENRQEMQRENVHEIMGGMDY
jgi:hypothetical protein